MKRWQFEELIDALNSPDWWSIGITSAITIVNASIMVWLGMNQYKLQKRQTEAQEYEIYKSLYVLLVQVHDKINAFMSNVSFGTWDTYYQADKELLKREEILINRLKEDLTSNYIDYDLKLSLALFDKEAYHRILSTMSAILYHVNKAIDNNEVSMPIGCQHIPNVDGDMEKSQAVAIAKRFKHTDMMFVDFMNFLEQKRNLGSCDDALKVIKEKCKIY